MRFDDARIRIVNDPLNLPPNSGILTSWHLLCRFNDRCVGEFIAAVDDPSTSSVPGDLSPTQWLRFFERNGFIVIEDFEFPAHIQRDTRLPAFELKPT